MLFVILKSMSDTLIVALIVYALSCGGFCGFLAEEKRRDGASWFVLGMIFGIIALLTLVGAPIKPPKEE